MRERLFPQRGRHVLAAILLLTSAVAALIAWRAALPEGVPSPHAFASKPSSAESEAEERPVQIADPVRATERIQITDPRGLAEIEETLARIAEGATKRRGAALIPNPRAEAMKRTAQLTLEELVWDLGEYWTSRGYVFASEHFEPSDSSWFAAALLGNVEVARLIEEGRRQPRLVHELLQDRVLRIWGGWAFFWQKRGIRFPPLPPAKGDGEHEKSVTELLKEGESTAYVFPAASLFIMVNINDDTALDIVAEILRNEPEPYKPAYRGATEGCRGQAPSSGILVWAVDCFLSRWKEDELPEAARPLLAKHRELTAGFNISSTAEKMSSWSTTWSVHDIYVSMLGLDVSDVETLDVVGIPPDLDKTTDSARREEILRNFARIYDCIGRRWDVLEKYRVQR